MAQRPTTIKFTFGVTGTSGYLADIMGRRQKTWIKSLAMRADRGNANDILWVVRGGTPGGYIGPGEAAVFDFGEAGTLVATFQLLGNANDTVYLTIGIDSDYFDQTDLT